jgi:hypothetical protein
MNFTLIAPQPHASLPSNPTFPPKQISTNANELLTTIQATLRQFNLQSLYTLVEKLQFTQVCTTLKQVQEQLIALSSTTTDNQPHHKLENEYSEILLSLNQILPQLEQLSKLENKPGTMAFSHQKPSPLARLISLVEEARLLLPTPYIPANIKCEAKQIGLIEDQLYAQEHGKLSDIQSYQLIYKYFKQIVTELTQRFATTSNGEARTILQGIASQLEAIDPAYIDWNNHGQPVGSVQKLTTLVKLLAKQSSNLQNLDPNLLQNPSYYQVYNALAKLVQGNRNYPSEPGKKIHSNHNLVITSPNLDATADSGDNPNQTTTFILTQALIKFFNKPAPLRLTNDKFVTDLSNYILSQQSNQENTLPAKILSPHELPEQAILEIQLAIAAYHIFLCISKSASDTQPLVNILFDLTHFANDGNHYEEYKSLIRLVLGKYSQQPQKNADKYLINYFLPNKSATILMAVQNYLYTNQVISRPRPLYSPYKHLYATRIITASIAALLNSKTSSAEILKQVNAKLTEEWGETAPFISFIQLNYFQDTLLSYRLKNPTILHKHLQSVAITNPQEVSELNPRLTPNQEVNDLSTYNKSLTLNQQVTKFFAQCEPNLAENKLIQKLHSVIQDPLHMNLQGKLLKCIRVSQLPNDCKSEGKFIITVYLIYLILREYRRASQNTQVIKDCICDFSYFSQETEQYTQLRKLMDTLCKKYAIHRINNIINDFLILHNEAIILAAQQYFKEQGLISGNRQFYRASRNQQYDVDATIQEIKLEINESKLSRYQQMKYANKKMAEKLGESAPFLSLYKIIYLRHYKKAITTSIYCRNMQVINEVSTIINLTKRKGEDITLVLNE